MSIYDTSAPRKAANLSVNSDLLRQARELGINLSRTFEQGLEACVREQRREQWLAENREALESYNRYVQRHGVFSDEFRRF